MQTGMSDDLENVTDAPKTSIIDRELERLNIDIVGLQETRLAGFGSTKEKNYTFFWQGLQEEEKRIHGVGFAIRNKLLPTMEPPKQGSERIFSIRLQTSSGFTTFVCCYAPTLSAEVDQKDQFYAQLDDTINKIPSSDDLYLLGDFNARVGAEKCLWPEVLGAHGIGRMNENGQRLLEFCSHHHLCITNTFFECKLIHKGTWRHPRSKTWHQIDFTITKQSNLHNVKNSRTYHSADCNTDHSLVRSKIKFVPKAIYKPKKNGPPKIDISKAKCKKWKFKFHEKFNTTYQPVEDDHTTATTAWNYLKDTIHSCALETFGTKKRRNKDWYEANAEVIEPFLERKRNAMLKLKIDPNQSNKIEHQRLRNEAQRAARKCANEYYTNLAEKIQRASDTGNIRAMYEGINEAIGKQIKKPAPLKSKTGELLTDNKRKLERLVEHYVDLYSTNTSVSDKALEFFPQSSAFLFLDDEPTIQDVAEAIDCQQCGKAPGQDGISPDIIKCGKEALIEPLHAILCKCWEEGSVPQDMRDAKIITLYKNKGDRTDCNNYRGISLLSIVGKIFARVILSRLQFLGTLVYPEAQCGFRPQRSTIDMIFATRQIQEKCREQQMPLYIAFIDLTKAFDLVSRDGLFKVLKKIGCPEKLLSIIISFHKSMTGVVSFDGEISSSFPITNGVKQGCVLAPTLFGIFFSMLLHYAFKDSTDGIYLHTRSDGSLFHLARLKAKTLVRKVLVRELLFADDAALVSHTEEGLQCMLSKFADACKEFGLTISIRKTQVMGLNTSSPPTLHLEGQPLEAVNDFVYLGSNISSSASLGTEIKRRIAKAASTMSRLSKRVWDNKKVTRATKMKVYQACVISTLLYGSESWATKAHQEDQLESFHMRSLRRILGIKWQDKVPNTQVLEDSGMLSIHLQLCKRRLRWLGHVRRMEDGRIPKDLLYAELREGRREVGCPQLRFKDVVKRDLKRTGISCATWECEAEDRDNWKSLVKDGVMEGEEDRRNTMVLKRQRRKARESQSQPPLTVMSCPHCLTAFDTQRELCLHLRTRHSNQIDWARESQSQPPLTVMSCPHCLMAFDTQRDLYLHLRTRHSNQIDWN